MEDNTYDDSIPKPQTGYKPLSNQELEWVKDQLLESIYADIGKSVVRKILWVVGAISAAVFLWLAKLGHIKIGG